MEDRLSELARPFVREGVASVSLSAARKRTRIFRSWMDDLDVCSMFDH
jgi:hypothetical protein